MSRTRSSIYILFSLLCLVNVSLCADILMISPLPSVSHSLWNQKLANLIVTETNHHVTIVDVFHQMIKHPKITHIELGNPIEYGELDLSYFTKYQTGKQSLDLLNEWIDLSTKNLINMPKTKQFLDEYKGKKFDLIIFDGGCCEAFLGFVDVFGSPPLIIATAFGSASFLMDYAGNYDNPSYVAGSMSPYIAPMNFMERLENTLVYIYFNYLHHYKSLNNADKLAKEFFGNEISNVRDIASRAVVTLINYHPTLDGVKPLLPSIVSIGGFHIEPTKPLETELQKFLDNSKNGVIYVSFGSNLKCTKMDEDKFNIFVQAFKELKQNVVWKCEKSIPNQPKNIFLGKWFNQSDILAHPNVKVFISHGGLLGTQEAVYHGVPVLVFPFVIDQHINAKRLEKMGVAIPMSYMDVTVSGLKKSINTLLTDPSFRETMKARSAAFRDNPISPRNLTLFWIEYVLRHPNTDLLRSATQEMSIFQILLLDVIIFLVSIVLTILIVFIYLIRKILNIFRKTKPKKKTS